jgi:hypothetical protein
LGERVAVDVPAGNWLPAPARDPRAGGLVDPPGEVLIDVPLVKLAFGQRRRATSQHRTHRAAAD